MFSNPSIVSECGRFEFDISNVDLAIVNSIRRVILSDIPMLGFMGEVDVSVEILKNTGPLHNEIMIHRIGTLPLHFIEEEIEGFVENEYVFSCTAKNTDAKTLNVTTKEMKGKHNDVVMSDREITRIFPPNDITKEHILITRLRQGEELTFVAKVVKKTAKDHAAFSPVSLCAFFYKEDTAKTKEMKDILDKERTYLKNEYGDPIEIHFMLETETGLAPRYIIAKAIEILIAKNDTIHSEVDRVDSTKVSVVKNPNMDDTFDMTINDEDDTLGNLFQSLIYTHGIREGQKLLNNKYTLSYVGYYAPHPLDKKIVIRMTLKNETLTCDEKDFINVMKECLRIVDRELLVVRDAWVRFEQHPKKK